MGQKKREPGELIIIGGHEEKEGDPEILKVVAERAGKGMLLVATLASSVGMEQWQEYRRVFEKLGVKKIEHLDLETRAEAGGNPVTYTTMTAYRIRSGQITEVRYHVVRRRCAFGIVFGAHAAGRLREALGERRT